MIRSHYVRQRALRASTLVAIRTAGWIKMRLGTEIGLDPGHIVLDADPAAP